MKKISLLALTAIIFAACNNQKAPSELQGISLSKSELSMEMGETKKLVVIYEPEDAEAGAPKVIWESTKERVATVDENGKVTAKQKGRATIVASCGKFAAECKVEVSTGGSTPVVPPDPSKFSVSTKEINSPADGGTFTIDVTANIAWSASCEESWASISPNNGDGNATVTVTVEPNTAEKADEQDITFTAGEFTEYVTIRRAGKGKDPDPEPEKIDPVFSVSSSRQVYFSKGNLQYKASTDTWRFADEQSEYIGSANTNISSSYSGWIDLFGWGTGNNPTFASNNNESYTTFTDWGNNTISNGDSYSWRTLTSEEWGYMLDERTNHSKLRGIATIGDTKGYIFLPDKWSAPSGVEFTPNAESWTTNKYSLSEWSTLEESGAVFLPAAGDRYEGSYENLDEGHYWSSTEEESRFAFGFGFRYDSKNKYTQVAGSNKKYGFSVRLVRNK